MNKKKARIMMCTHFNTLRSGRAPGSCPECPCFDPSGDFECIEYLMSQAAAALKEYSCNGGGEL